MQRFKKVVAIALTATMVLGCAVTAFAGDNDGSSTGTGTSEGHVEKKATSVVLPTIAQGSTPFAYTMDPERLITETSHAKYGDAVEFPASNDTGVYWNNGPKGGEGTDKDNIVYKNTSPLQTVTNKSSHAIDLTVSVAASSAATDIPLVAQSAVASATDPSLYLGLKVGSADAVAISTSAAATKTVSIAGTPANFKTAVKTVEGNKVYEYRALTLDEYKALDGNSSKTQDDYDATWGNTTFNLEGAVTSGKAITSTTTAPTVTVTWSWVDPDATPADAAPSIATTEYTMTANTPIEIEVDLGRGEDAAEAVSAVMDPTGAYDYLSGGYAEYNSTDKKVILKANMVDACISANVGSVDIVFDEGTTVTITLNKE